MLYFPGYQPPCHIQCSWYPRLCGIKRSHLLPHFIRRWETFSVGLISKIWHISTQSLNRNFCFFPNSISFNNSVSFPFFIMVKREANLNLSSRIFSSKVFSHYTDSYNSVFLWDFSIEKIKFWGPTSYAFSSCDFNVMTQGNTSTSTQHQFWNIRITR